MKACFFALMLMLGLATPAHAAGNELVHDLGDFCMELASRLAAGDTDYMLSRLDQSRLLADMRFIGDRLASPDELKALAEGINRGLSRNVMQWKLPWHIAAVARGNPEGSCTLVGNLGHDETTSASGLVGIRLIVEKSENDFVLKDVVYPNGSSLFVKATMMMPDLFRAIEIMEKPFLHDPQTVQDARELIRLIHAIGAGDDEAIVSGYKKSGEHIRQNELLADRFMASAQLLPEKEYRESLVFYIENVKAEIQDPTLLIDHYYFLGKTDLALAALERISPFYAGSYSVGVLSTSLQQTGGDLAALETKALALLEQNPNVEAVYWLLFNEYVHDREYERATLVMDVLVNAYGYTFGRTLKSEPAYLEFSRSPEFRRWRKRSS